MAQDATPERIELVNSNFTNQNHEEIATILQDEWSASTTFTQLGEEFEPHRATFQKVYNKYFGVPEELFQDGIEDNRTIDEIKDEHDSYKEYRELRSRGYIDPSEHRNVEWKEGYDPEEEDSGPKTFTYDEVMEMTQEAYRKGWKDRGEEMQSQQ